MKRFAAQTVVNAIALWLAAAIVGGIHLSDDFWAVVFVAIVFGLVNAVLKPIAILLSLPAIILTLGVFILVVNTAMLGLTAALTDSLDVDGFWSGVGGAAIISIVSWSLSSFVPDREHPHTTLIRED